MYKLRRYIVFILLFQFIPGSLILLKTRSSSPDPTTITRPHAIAEDEDWLVLTADSFIQEEPDPTSLRWYWRWGVLMYGLWKAYGTTGDSNYLDYIRSYVDHYVPLNGNITSHLHPTEALNRVIPAALLPLLYEETLEQKYLTATQIVADYVMDDCDRTAEGGLISTKDWLMLDGVYGVCLPEQGRSPVGPTHVNR